MKFSVRIRQWHRWLALVVGVQLLLWTISGLFMSFVPIESVRSESFVEKKSTLLLDSFSSFISLHEAQSKLDRTFGSIEEVKVKQLLDFPVYEFKNHEGSISLIHALSGQNISPISEELVKKIVISKLKEKNVIKSLKLIKDPVIEYRGQYPVWRIDFENFDSTSFYVDPNDGDVKAVRGNIWRIYDFLWMLHIMDYSKRENFNHWWLVLASFLALSVSVSGFILFFYSFRKRDFKFFK